MGVEYNPFKNKFVKKSTKGYNDADSKCDIFWLFNNIGNRFNIKLLYNISLKYLINYSILIEMLLL